jgi:radical SAM superfamily enzyme with C-terminal helix-hairpin-helix motif
MNTNIEIGDEELLFNKWFDENIKNNLKKPWLSLIVPSGVNIRKIFMDGFVEGYNYAKKFPSDQ